MVKAVPQEKECYGRKEVVRLVGAEQPKEFDYLVREDRAD